MSKGKIEVSIKDIPHIINVLEKMEKEIQFERKSKTIFIDDLYKLCEMSLKQTQEIERLNNIIKQYDKVSFIHEMELQKRIDKAIKYIESYMPNYDFDKTNLIKLLEILNKGESND